MRNYRVTTALGQHQTVEATKFAVEGGSVIFYDDNQHATHFFSGVVSVCLESQKVDVVDRTDRVKHLCDLLRSAAAHIPDSSLTGSLSRDIAAALDEWKL